MSEFLTPHTAQKSILQNNNIDVGLQTGTSRGRKRSLYYISVSFDIGKITFNTIRICDAKSLALII